MNTHQLHPQAFRKLTAGHPWLKRRDFKSSEGLPNRACFIFFGEHWWSFSPESHICMRRFGPINRNFLKSDRQVNNGADFITIFGDWLFDHLRFKLQNKIKTVFDKDDMAFRWIFSENDLVPGLIVDVFNDHLVCQINTAPLELVWLQLRDLILKVFTSVTDSHPKIIELRSATVRAEEGLPIIAPAETHELDIRINGFRIPIHLGDSQKTGTYLDQKQNHIRVAEIANQFGVKSAWDIFCYQGGFTLPLLRNGAEVWAVDSSGPALARLATSIESNGLDSSKCHIEESDAFNWLREKPSTLPKPDLIILDPPSFVKNEKDLNSAVGAYKELYLQAIKSLGPGGLLVSAVCSHYMDRDTHRHTLAEAAHDARREMVLLETFGPARDHAPSILFPEGEYLQTWILQICN